MSRTRPRSAVARRAEPREPDRGAALLLVVSTMAMLMLFVLSAGAFALNNSAAGRADQDSKAALAAARAGVDEYLYRLNLNDSYWTNANVDASNPAFGTGTALRGTAGTSGAWFTYRVLTAVDDVARDGYLQLQSTGYSTPGPGRRVVRKTLTATLKPLGFVEFLYLTDKEVLDPGLYNPADGRCDDYWYPYPTPSSPSRSAASGCREIQWTTGDIVNGPLHTNDTLWVNGSVLFGSPDTGTSWSTPTTAGKYWRGNGTPQTSPTGYLPQYADPLTLPTGNDELLRYVEPRVDVPGATPGPGCLYTGATRIVLTGTKMRVLSPSTTNAPSRCLDVASRGTEQLKDIPPVIYVKATTGSCSNGALGFPASGESTAFTTTNYDCRRGTAYVRSDSASPVDAQVTVAGEDDVLITGDIKVKDVTGTDMVGLVAGNYIWVYHPVTSGGANLYATPPVRTVQASLLALRHSFLVQNWDRGAALSTTTDVNTKLTVYGSIAQAYRGPVGTGSGSAPTSGYLKNYQFDTRLATLQPPYFLRPARSPWRLSVLTDG